MRVCVCACFRENETVEREERTRECVCFGIRASTGETPQMGDTLDIRFCFTTHCLFTRRYVQRVCICAVAAFPGVLVSAYYVCPLLYVHVNATCIHVSFCKFVCLHVLFLLAS